MDANIKNLSQDIRRAFAAQAEVGTLAATDRYEKSAEFSNYNLRSAQFSEVLKTFLPVFKQLTPEKRRALAENLLRSGMHELVATAIRLVALDLRSLLPEHSKFVVRMPDHFHGWGSTDDFCINVVHPLMLRQPEDVLPLLQGASPRTACACARHWYGIRRTWCAKAWAGRSRTPCAESANRCWQPSAKCGGAACRG
jgi:hypothetical protein